MRKVLVAVSVLGFAFPATGVLSGQAAPSVTSVSPGSSYNYASTAIIIAGTGFQATPTVTLGASVLSPVTFVNSTTLTATVPAQLLAGPYDLTVTNPDAQSATMPSAFTVRASRGGHLGPWAQVSLPTGISASDLLVLRKPYAYFYIPGTGGTPNSVLRGTIQVDGSLAEWQSFAGPGSGGSGRDGATDGQYIWIVRAFGFGAQHTIDWAPLASDGTIGPWTQLTVPFAKVDFGFVAVNGYLLAIGGSPDGISIGGGPSWRAQILADGAPGPWEQIASPPELGARPGSSTAATIGSDVFAGLSFTYLLTPVSSAVFHTRVSDTGDVQPWETVSTNDGYLVTTAGAFVYRSRGTGVVATELLSDHSLGPGTVEAAPSNGAGRLFSSGDFVFGAKGSGLWKAQFSPLSLAGTTYSPASGGVVTLAGTDFLPGSSVTVDGVQATDVVVSGLQQLTARVAAHASGAASVTLTTPEGRSTTSSTALVFDGIAPTGTIQINANAPITASQSVTLTLAASDEASGVASMAISNDGSTFSAFEPYATSKAWTLPDSDGTRTVYARFRDAAGNVSANVTDQIVMDRRPPAGSVGVNFTAISTMSRNVQARVSAAPATTASVVSDVSFSFDGASWDAWQTYSTNPYGLVLPAGDGLKTVYARFRDSSGNVSSAVTDGIYLDTGVVANTVSINAAAVYTNNRNVTLRLGGSPLTTEMQISNDGGFAGAAWEPYASRRSWTLADASALGPSVTTRFVYVRYRPSSIGETTVQDDIILDTTPPSGAVSMSGSGSQLVLSASDDLSGVADMAIGVSLSFPGTAWEPLAATRAWPGGTPYVKFRDRAGNVSRVFTPAGAQNPTAPFGSFDSPGDGMTAYGSVAFGGWALDDAGVTAVRIFRDAVPGEAAGEVFIGNAVFVDGARPDVAGLFSTLPAATRGGWGLMVLTPVLPNAGNGTFTFSAYADDSDGHTTSLGRRTLVLDNATAIAPFGTIDTPEQGGTISGTSYPNFGWVLTPLPKQIPIDGSTITVFIDGQPIGHPMYNLRREDVAGLFPTLANANGAIGYLPIDTTRYADGLHTIGWSVVDDAGAAAGIGSRYFRVQNSPALRAASVTAASPSGPTSSSSLTMLDACAPGSRTGHDPDAAWQPLTSKDGALELATTTDRIELRFCAPILSAHLVQNRERRPLATGASIDAAAGLFSWAPGPAFLGEFEFVLELGSASADLPGPILRVTIRLLARGTR